MKALSTAIGSIAAIAVWLAAPATAAEPTESVVPPENSAATQYTEALPTAGGNKESGGGGKGGHRSPANVLGARNAHRLESHGKQGREVAEVVAETAPSTSAPTAERQGPGSKDAAADKQAGNGRSEQASQPAPGGETSQASQSPSDELPGGSSGLGEVLAAATGSSSSGQPGFLLPLAIAAAIAWAISYLLRERRRAG
jgi:hypothetical protein